MVAAIIAWGGAFAVVLAGLTAPVFEPGALVGLALPLFIVTMASQNVTGMTVLATYGYRPRLPTVLAGTGVSAPFWGLLAGLALLAVPYRRPA